MQQTPTSPASPSPAVPQPPADDLALVTVYPDDVAAGRGHDRPRARPPRRRHPDDIAASTRAKVGGLTAGGIDFADYLAGRLPLLIGAVLLLSFLLLMVVFRSLLVPLKAVIMNLLSVGAAYGVIVAIFQWGWGKGLDRRRQDRPDRGLGADDAVRHRVRSVDGLRGVPAVADQGGVRPHRRQRHRRRRRPGRHGPGHHRRGADHGLRVRRLRARRRPPAQAVRPRPGGRRARRRHDRPHGPRAGDDGAARRPELVAPEVARPHPAEDRRRGHTTRADPLPSELEEEPREPV